MCFPQISFFSDTTFTTEAQTHKMDLTRPPQALSGAAQIPTAQGPYIVYI